MRTVLAASIVIAATALPAAGGELGATVGVGYGYAIPVDDLADHYKSKPVSVSAYLTGPISDRLQWRLDLGMDKVSANDELKSSGLCGGVGRVCGDATFKHFTGGVQVDFAAGEVYPYALFMVGWYGQEYSVAAGGINISPSRNDFGLNFGGGVDWYVGGGNWGVGGEVKVHFVAAEENTELIDGNKRWFLSPQGHIFIEF